MTTNGHSIPPAYQSALASQALAGLPDHGRLHPPVSGKLLIALYTNERRARGARRDRIKGAVRRRNARQDVSTFRGAGLARRARKIRRTVASLIGCPSRVSSPCTRRYPRAGFSRASRSTRSRISWLALGRPGRFGYVHLRVTRRRCQASSVPGVTSRWARSTVGSSRASAARIARSAQSGLARVT